MTRVVDAYLSVQSPYSYFATPRLIRLDAHPEVEVRPRPVRLRAALLANNEALLAAGHWGVPCFVVGGEPFYGQDRFDQLLWRLGVTLEET